MKTENSVKEEKIKEEEIIITEKIIIKCENYRDQINNNNNNNYENNYNAARDLNLYPEPRDLGLYPEPDPVLMSNDDDDEESNDNHFNPGSHNFDWNNFFIILNLQIMQSAVRVCTLCAQTAEHGGLCVAHQRSHLGVEVKISSNGIDGLFTCREFLPYQRICHFQGLLIHESTIEQIPLSQHKYIAETSRGPVYSLQHDSLGRYVNKTTGVPNVKLMHESGLMKELKENKKFNRGLPRKPRAGVMWFVACKHIAAGDDKLIELVMTHNSSSW